MIDVTATEIKKALNDVNAVYDFFSRISKDARISGEKCVNIRFTPEQIKIHLGMMKLLKLYLESEGVDDGK